MNLTGPVSTDVEHACEQVLRSLPNWFGDEGSLLEYAHATKRLPTFVALDDADVIGFLTLEQHFSTAWEVHCIAVHGDRRGRGIGRAMHTHVEAWLLRQGARLLQVKTLADSHPSPEYAETRAFYRRLGYHALEVFPRLWAPHLPVLLAVKVLDGVESARMP